MNNNNILKRIRYMFDFDDSKMIELFTIAEYPVDRSIISNWLKQEDEPSFEELTDKELAVFLNGLIIDKRGMRETGVPAPETELDNNTIFRKIKIALNLKNEEVIAIFALANKKIGKHELSAFFRNPKQSQFRPCNDQYFRNFMSGLQRKYRPK